MNGHGHLDRTGEPIEDLPDEEQQPLHDPRCVNGWVDRDGDHPKPCLDCKPHLAPDRLRFRVHGVDPGPRQETGQ